ncbi:MAG: transposase [bacterium]|nr:transposase [bacterium]
MERRLRFRGFFESSLYQVLYHHYEDFQEGYGRERQSDLGYFRHDVDETIAKFMECGDPRLGVARFECEDCQTRLYVPFSCKTRLFCPSCHTKFSELWVEQLMSEVIRPEVPHRFWTFSIPKRLRPYFRQRKRLTWLIQAAKETIYLAMGRGKVRNFEKPGIITLIQTHGDELNWNCHLHTLITDGVFDYSNPNEVKFHPFCFWDIKGMTEIFRRLLLKRLHREGVLSQEVVENLMSWPHSGFHVYAGEAFRDSDRIRRTLSYAFRPAVSLKQLTFDPNTRQVRYRSKKGKALQFKPNDFIATLTQHIPDRYQNMRRYAGFYAANVRLRIQRAQAEENKDDLPEIRMAGPIRLHWAKLIAKIFGENPVQCPKCHKDMKLKGFLLKTNLIFKEIQVLSRAPPRKEFPRYRDLPDQSKISLEPDEGWARAPTATSGIKDIPEEFFDQSVNW